jgi:hypothetical protein
MRNSSKSLKKDSEAEKRLQEPPRKKKGSKLKKKFKSVWLSTINMTMAIA